ncbi:MAG: hypothetical protein JJU37_14215 [Balneolaceae bacterium]|nr:hypothetical protein [Balneolaceae bacterium]
MITWLLYSFLSMGILLLFYHTVLIKEKMYRINRGYLLFSLIFSLIIPLAPTGIVPLPADLFFHEISNEQHEHIYADHYYNRSAALDGEVVVPPGEPVRASKSLFIPILVGIYITVALILFVRLLRIIHMIQMKSNRNPRTLFEGYEVALLNEKVVPHTFLNTIFVNKKQFERNEIGREVLLHELTHAKQKHSIDILFVELLKVLFWFNPLLYLYKRAIHLNHEFLADEAVLKSGIPVSDYQQTLLKTLLYSPSHTLASSLNFGLTKKRLHMMTQSFNKTQSVMKIASLIPLFIVLALLLGCESTPADSAPAIKEITIELTDSDLIKLNGEEMEISGLEEKLEEYSQNHELRFVVKDHPDMKSGPVFTVNTLVHKYTDPENSSRQSLLQIDIDEASEIIVDGEALSLNDLNDILKDRLKDRSLIISLRVERGSEMQTILDVQNLIRTQEVSRVNYSVKPNPKSELDRVTQEYLKRVTEYMDLKITEVSLSELEESYAGIIEHLDKVNIAMQNYDFPPPPPPVPPSPERRLESSAGTAQNRTAPAPPVPAESNNLLTILLNAQGSILVNDQPETVSGIKSKVKDFVGNYGNDPNLSVNPQEAILVIRRDSRLAYESYIEILDEIMAAYNELRNDYAVESFGISYSAIDEESHQYRQIRDAYPKRISIGETGN